METREHEAFVSSGTHAEWQDEPLNDILAKVIFFKAVWLLLNGLRPF